jgi:hypothetical protein
MPIVNGQDLKTIESAPGELVTEIFGKAKGEKVAADGSNCCRQLREAECS